VASTEQKERQSLEQSYYERIRMYLFDVRMNTNVQHLTLFVQLLLNENPREERKLDIPRKRRKKPVTVKRENQYSLYSTILQHVHKHHSVNKEVLVEQLQHVRSALIVLELKGP
jgi:hypothetical protein